MEMHEYCIKYMLDDNIQYTKICGLTEEVAIYKFKERARKKYGEEKSIKILNVENAHKEDE